MKISLVSTKLAPKNISAKVFITKAKIPILCGSDGWIILIRFVNSVKVCNYVTVRTIQGWSGHIIRELREYYNTLM